MLEYQNTKTFLNKAMFQTGLKKLFAIKKVKNTVPWTYVISDLKSEEIVGTFYKKNCKKQIKKSLELKK